MRSWVPCLHHLLPAPPYPTPVPLPAIAQKSSSRLRGHRQTTHQETLTSVLLALVVTAHHKPPACVVHVISVTTCQTSFLAQQQPVLSCWPSVLSSCILPLCHCYCIPVLHHNLTSDPLWGQKKKEEVGGSARPRVPRRPQLTVSSTSLTTSPAALHDPLPRRHGTLSLSLLTALARAAPAVAVVWATALGATAAVNDTGPRPRPTPTRLDHPHPCPSPTTHARRSRVTP